VGFTLEPSGHITMVQTTVSSGQLQSLGSRLEPSQQRSSVQKTGSMQLQNSSPGYQPGGQASQMISYSQEHISVPSTIPGGHASHIIGGIATHSQDIGSAYYSSGQVRSIHIPSVVGTSLLSLCPLRAASSGHSQVCWSRAAPPGHGVSSSHLCHIFLCCQVSSA
jgi:hypothetical protein